ncbi:MAG: hypothetical protein AB1486_09205 [Planctomycetota bacterium]
MRCLLATSLVVLALVACTSTDEGRPSPPRADTGRDTGYDGGYDGGHVPYTSNWKVRLGDEIQGYLIRYEQIPLHEAVTRDSPTGTVLVQNSRLEAVGFVTPRGAAYRLSPGATEGVVYSQYLENDPRLEKLVALILDLPDSLTIEPLGN